MANEFKEPGIVCYAIENHPADSRVKVDGTGTFQSLTARCGTGWGNTPMVMIVLGNSNSKAVITEDDTCPTLLGVRGGHSDVPIIACEQQAIGFDAYQHHNWKQSETLGPLTTGGGAASKEILP